VWLEEYWTLELNNRLKLLDNGSKGSGEQPKEEFGQGENKILIHGFGNERL